MTPPSESKNDRPTWCQYRAGTTWERAGTKWDKCTCPDRVGSKIVMVQACRPKPSNIDAYLKYQVEPDEPLPLFCEHFAPGKAPPGSKGSSLVTV